MRYPYGRLVSLNIPNSGLNLHTEDRKRLAAVAVAVAVEAAGICTTPACALDVAAGDEVVENVEAVGGIALVVASAVHREASRRSKNEEQGRRLSCRLRPHGHSL